MRIKKIILDNFRIYHGVNEIDLSVQDGKNISLISGNNGFGKTSFLTSLVWCLYGKMMAEVDEKYKSEINDAGGYNNYCHNIFNRTAGYEKGPEIDRLLVELEEKDLPHSVKTVLKDKIDRLNSYSVTIELEDVHLPSFPCKQVTITRTHNVVKSKEQLEIWIDGQENELSREVGSDIFINDFILPKEIAKFFFFDAEKIVSLAESKSSEEKRKLSKAYAEVLGIKKYVDLKNNLENLQARLLKKSAKGTDLNKLERLLKDQREKELQIAEKKKQLLHKEDNINRYRLHSDDLQEKLIREGASVSVEKLKQWKVRQKELEEHEKSLKSKVKEMTELAPFALVPELMEKVKKQLKQEASEKQKALSKAFLKEKSSLIQKELEAFGRSKKMDMDDLKQLTKIVNGHLAIEEKQPAQKTLLDYSIEQTNRVFAVHSNVQTSYRQSFDQIAKDFKQTQGNLNSVRQKLRNAESKEKDGLIQEVRKDKAKVDQQLAEAQVKKGQIQAELKSIENELSSIARQISELDKKVKVADRDQKKQETTSRLIAELDAFMSNLKDRKKASLEAKLKAALNTLMHKNDFVKRIEVVLEGEFIDFLLFDEHDELIQKEGLSKGEQQLFATALLKSLVDESSIKFPVFIDSPLQKLDKVHAENIIEGFYPYVSDQVILFPLLEKELAEREYKLLQPKISKLYFIKNNSDSGSYFEAVAPEKLFENYQSQSHVHQH